MTGLDAAIRRYYLFRCSLAVGFVSPFLVAVLVARDVSYTAVALGLTALSVANVVSEVPTGYVGDRVGRRASMAVGGALAAVTATGWVVARTAPAVVALYALTGLWMSFYSGSAWSWLYDTLAEYDAADRYSAVAGRATSLMRATTAVTMLVGAGLYVLVSPLAAFLANAAAAWLGVATALALPANARYREDGDDERVGPRAAARAMRSFGTRPAVRTVVAFSAVFAAAAVVASRYVQPIVDAAVRAGGPSVAGWTLPAVVVLSAVGATHTVASAVAVDRAAAVEARLGTGRTVLAMYAASGLSMLAPFAAAALGGSVVLASAVAMLAFHALPGVARVVRDGYLHDHADSLSRATVMSSVALAHSLVRIPVVLTAGVVADAVDPTVAVAGAGGCALAVGLGLVAVDGPLVVDDGGASQNGSTGAPVGTD